MLLNAVPSVRELEDTHLSTTAEAFCGVPSVTACPAWIYLTLSPQISLSVQRSSGIWNHDDCNSLSRNDDIMTLTLHAVWKVEQFAPHMPYYVRYTVSVWDRDMNIYSSGFSLRVQPGFVLDFCHCVCEAQSFGTVVSYLTLSCMSHVVINISDLRWITSRGTFHHPWY